jgi:imidazolonepropionase-like amidohydrolase
MKESLVMSRPHQDAGFARRLVVRLWLLVLGLLPTAAYADGPPPEKVALVGGRIIPVVGEPIEGGTVLIERGRITAIGAEVKLPYDAVEIDCSGKVLFPGMIDPFNWRGLDIPNEAVAVAPYLDVYDAIDPSRSFFEETLRNGITAVHISPDHNLVIGAVTRVMRPIGLTPEEMTLRSPVAIQMATTPRSGSDRMTQLVELRGAFAELDRYLAQRAEERYAEERKRKGEEVDLPPAEAREKGRELLRDVDLDDAHRNLHRLREGAMEPWLYAGTATDVASAVAIAREQGFLERATFLIQPDTIRAVGELAASGRPVVCSDDLLLRTRDPFTGEIDEVFLPSALHAAGVPFALRPNPSGSLPERYLTYQAARCVRAGVPRGVALRAITLHPARFLGLGDELGSLEVGKRGDVVVLSGDPLDFSSWVEEVYIDGILAYDRDTRLGELLGPMAEATTSTTETAEAPAEEASGEPSPEGGDSDGGDDDRTGDPDEGGSDNGGSDEGGSDEGGSDEGGSDEGGSDEGGERR